MVLAFAVFPYLIGGIAMWFIAHQVAPVGYNASMSRCVFALVLMGLGGELAGHFLRPMVGDWSYLAEFGVSALLGMLVLQLTFWRSLFAVIVYWIVFFVAGIVIGLVFARGAAH